MLIPPFLAEKHGYVTGTEPSDALIEDLALHFSLTVYHHSCTCRIGAVVDPRLRITGVGGLRVADASVMPSVIGRNTNASCIMIGEKGGRNNHRRAPRPPRRVRRRARVTAGARAQLHYVQHLRSTGRRKR